MDLFSGEPDILNEDCVLPAESEDVRARSDCQSTAASGEFAGIRCGHGQRLVEKHIGGSDESADAFCE
jgi:hypothetical protein